MFTMKKLNLILTLVIVVVSLSNCKNKSKNEATLAEKTNYKTSLISKTETASFTISGMSCAVMCANKIEKELAATKGVQKAKVDFDKQSAFITFDSNVITAEKLVEKVEAVAGGKIYKVSNLKTSMDKAMYIGDPEKERMRIEKRAAKIAAKEARRAAKEAAKNPMVDAKTKASGCCTGKKSCSKDEKSGTM